MQAFKMQPDMHVDDSGHLHLGGISVSELATKYGTPLYVLSESTIRQNCRRYLAAFEQEYPDAVVAYAGKAFLCRAMAALVAQEGLWLDVVSGGELYTAISAGFPAMKVIFHGVSRTRAEIELALTHRVGRIVVDNNDELERVAACAQEMNVIAPLLLRVTTGVEAETHHYVQTSLVDSKFGFHLDDLPAVVKRCLSDLHLSVIGLHCHIGSQIFCLDSFVQNLRTLFRQIHALEQQYGRQIAEVNVGGGLGVYYKQGDNPPEIEEYVKVLANAAKTEAHSLGMQPPRLVIEPGRSIINEAGIMLYRVTGSKSIPGLRKYVYIDGGMPDNIRPALYEAEYEAVLGNRMHSDGQETVSIAGRCCETGDMLAWDTDLPPAQTGDLLVMARTGAYTYSMASNYNRLPRPAVVLVNSGRSEVIIGRETYADLIKLDLLPEHLRGLTE